MSSSDATTGFTSGTSSSSFSMKANDGTKGIGFFNGVVIGTSGSLPGSLAYQTIAVLKSTVALDSTYDATNAKLTLAFKDTNGIPTGTLTMNNVYGYAALDSQSGDFTLLGA